MFKGLVTTLVLFLFFATTSVQGQQIKPNGRFLKDSIKIGVPIGFSLAVKHPRDIDIIFPDSLYDFGPYELDHKRYFPTQSDSAYSYDSAIYYITSFEIDSIQTFSLPVFVLHGNDSTAIYTAFDSVILQQLVAEVPDSVAIEAIPLKENTTYKRVSFQFNYPYFIIGTLILVLIIVLVIAFFGKRIKNYFLLRRMNKKHNKFIESYDRLVNNSEQSVNVQAERILVLWKQYLEKLLVRPYTQLTTKEILDYYKPQNIADALKTVDRTIYGNKPEKVILTENFTALKNYAQEKYEEKAEEVKNG
ncbi:MAG: hypothetical protein WD555_00915 [Fulvivirga sp.]